MAFSEVASDKVKTLTKERRLEAKHKQKAIGSAKELMKAGLGLVIDFMDIEMATKVEHSMSTYWCFNVGSKIVYCNQNKAPVMYKDGEHGELVYLDSQDKPKLGTYKMTEAGVVPV
jgi:UDP-3-O-acyl-N-acetylglucosamine deacetylase